MGFRDTLNKNPALALGVVVVVVGVAGYFGLRDTVGGGNSGGGSHKAYFTVDDGKTLFADEDSKVPPFQKDGHEAVKAYVFACNGKESVAYLERFTPDAKAMTERMNEATASGKPLPENPYKMKAVLDSGRQVKKPGDNNWLPTMSPQAMQFTNVTCNGQMAELKLP